MATKYKVDDALEQIIKHLIDSGKFPDTEDMRIKSVFAGGSAPKHHKEAASCRKVPALLRLLGDYDFVLVFWTNDWNAMTPEQRLKTVCHELHHVMQNDAGDPTLRPHGGDFCELPEHDKVSAELAKQVAMPPGLKGGLVQVTLD
jgi:predicted metallopeptidase